MKAPSADRINWSRIGEEAVDMLQRYIRFPTENKPDTLDADQARSAPWLAGREAEAATWLAEQLRAAGIEAELLEAAPGRVNLLARLRGRGTGRAVTLLSHSDVVPASPRQWSYDPYGGEIHEGYLYGRGTLDIKGLGIIHLMALVLMKRYAVPLERDVVLVIAADEEAGGHYGAEWLLAHRPELLDTEVVLGEGAYSTRGLVPYDGPIHAIAVGEKGYLELELVAEQHGHHASMPAPDNAPARLVQALERVRTMKRPLRVTPLAEAFLKNLALTSHGLRRRLGQYPHLLARLAPGHLSRSTIINALLQDTVAVTILDAGEKHNVVPSRARAVLSLRLLPDTDPEQLTEEIRSAIGDPTMAFRRLRHKPANASDFNAPAFRLLERHARSQHPNTIVTPLLSPGASDCRFWRLKGVPSYGWIPFVIPGEDLHRVHGPDERVSVEAFQAGLRSYYEALCELATVPS